MRNRSPYEGIGEENAAKNLGACDRRGDNFEWMELARISSVRNVIILSRLQWADNARWDGPANAGRKMSGGNWRPKECNPEDGSSEKQRAQHCSGEV